MDTVFPPLSQNEKQGTYAQEVPCQQITTESLIIQVGRDYLPSAPCVRPINVNCPSA